eukprot:scaffold114192_cov66-Phaeocystis_antarctica.AAC.3
MYCETALPEARALAVSLSYTLSYTLRKHAESAPLPTRTTWPGRSGVASLATTASGSCCPAEEQSTARALSGRLLPESTKATRAPARCRSLSRRCRGVLL